jgi:ArsR family transcriptional regulator
LRAQSTLGSRQRPARATSFGTNSSHISEQTLEDLADVFQILSDPHRLKILAALARNSTMNVTDLWKLLGQSQPAVSHHLSLMRANKLVRCDRRGKNNFYRLDFVRLSSLLEQLFDELGNAAGQIQLDGLALSVKRR